MILSLMALPPRGMRNSNHLSFQSGFVAGFFTVAYGTALSAKFQNKAQKLAYCGFVGLYFTEKAMHLPDFYKLQDFQMQILNFKTLK